MRPISFDRFFQSNNIIVGNRNCGKTTLLKCVVNYAIDIGYKVIVFDSATDHADKSLIVYCKKIFDNYIEIDSPEREFIKCTGELKQYPYDILKNSPSSQIYLFDVSHYLEEGFNYEADDPRRNDERMLYKKLVIQCLVVLYEFVKHSKCLVLMDEIEFLPESASIIKNFNNDNIYFTNCIHSKDSVDENLKHICDIITFENVFPTKLGYICEKKETMLCGTACLHYYLNVVLQMNMEIPGDFVWITELAKFLSDIGIEHKLSCFDSSLYEDFFSGRIPQFHPAKLSICDYLSTGNHIYLKRFSTKDILYNRLPDTYFIASVRSVFLDDTSPKDSYHFILVHQSMDNFQIINPMRNAFVKMLMDVREFVQMINQSGNWVLEIINSRSKNLFFSSD